MEEDDEKSSQNSDAEKNSKDGLADGGEKGSKDGDEDEGTNNEDNKDEKNKGPKKVAKPGWYAWFYRNVNFGRYAPFDDEIQRTDIEFYEPPWFIKYTDKFARRMDRAGETQPCDLPPTWCGACCSFFFVLLAATLLYNSVNALFSKSVVLEVMLSAKRNPIYLRK